MNKKALALIGLTATLATAATFLFAAGPKDKEEGKFHLVYLVSTDKVEVGAKAYVEPLFFTDGKRLVFAYDYCRQYYQRKHHKPELAYRGAQLRKEDILYPTQIASNLKAVHAYCDNQSNTLNFSRFTVRDSSGLRLGLETVEFLPYEENRELYPPVLPQRGTTTIRDTSGQPLLIHEVQIKGGQQYFFLAAEKQQILDRIAPTQTIKPKDLNVLKAKIQEYVQRRVSAPKNDKKFQECDLGYSFTTSGIPSDKGPYRLEQAHLLAVTYADIDRDGKADVMVSLLEVITSDSSNQSVMNTTEVRIVRGNGQSQCLVWDVRVAQGAHPTLLPLAFIWVGERGYLLTSRSTFDPPTFSVISIVPLDTTKAENTTSKYGAKM